MKFGIVVITYRRNKSLERLLKQLNKVDYQGDEITLIISCDKSDNSEIISKIADNYEWSYGKKIVEKSDRNLGLRNHVLKCGNYMTKYDLDVIAIFEDDIYPSIGFYNYAKQAYEYYKDDERIEGISLYKHCQNIMAKRSFVPDVDASDIYMQQYAQSWGQVWWRKNWEKFYAWYCENIDFSDEKNILPDEVKQWPETSWLKYHIKYCVYNDRYFVYPQVSLTTCFSDAGVHTSRENSCYQQPLLKTSNKKYFFSKFENSIKYDVFFERMEIDREYENSLCVDLYGIKPNTLYKRYLLTPKELDFKIVDSFGLSLKPIECNYLEKVQGNDLFLYDTSVKQKNIFSNHSLQKYKVWQYDLQDITKLRCVIIAVITRCILEVKDLLGIKGWKKRG